MYELLPTVREIIYFGVGYSLGQMVIGLFFVGTFRNIHAERKAANALRQQLPKVQTRIHGPFDTRDF